MLAVPPRHAPDVVGEYAPVPDPLPCTGRRTDAGEDKAADGRVTLREAAIRLGVSEGAIRKRVARGTIRSELGTDGKRYVYLDEGADGGADASSTREPNSLRSDRDELIEAKDQAIRILEEQLREEREARKRADTIIAQLTQANAALAARVPELEPPPEPREAPETAAEGEERAEPRPATGGSQEGAQRPWWRRVFGG
jgi:hypothetical protein